MAEQSSISVAVVGSGGAGALTVGNLLLEAASAAGWQGLLTRTVWAGAVAGSVERTHRPDRRLATQEVNGGHVVNFQ